MVLLPVLGEPYGDVLESGQLRLCFESGAFAFCYFDRRFPVAARSYGRLLEHRLDELVAALGAESSPALEYQSILTAARNLPGSSETDAQKVAERSREKEIIKRRLAALVAESPPVRQFIEENVSRFNGQVGDADSFALLDDLLERQCYRLAYWRVAPDEINYRRFFDINDLAALSMEREEVFADAHGLILRLLAEGKVDGLRIDHPDGLFDPAQYFPPFAGVVCGSPAPTRPAPHDEALQWAGMARARGAAPRTSPLRGLRSRRTPQVAGRCTWSRKKSCGAGENGWSKPGRSTARHERLRFR